MVGEDVVEGGGRGGRNSMSREGLNYVYVYVCLIV